MGFRVRRAAWAVVLAIGATMAVTVGCASDLADAVGSPSPDSSVVANAGAATGGPAPAASTDSMVIDHRHTHLASIPAEWIEAAKRELHIAYGHTSHGSQIITGMTGLTKFANAPNAGSTYAWNDGGKSGALDLADTPFSGASDLGNPNFTAWAAATRRYLDDPANADVNVVMWSWCGEVSWASKANISTYLDLMSGLEREYPGVSFVYMTGHTDGSGLTGGLHVRNQQIRDYCEANDKILYDFEDIESWDPNGRYFGDKKVKDDCSYSGGNWAVEWQDSHTKGVDWYTCESAHSQPLNANLKAYAAWWLWARLAGWEKRVPPPAISSFTPGGAPIGAIVTLAGSGFSRAISVTFDGVAAASFTPISDTELKAVVPLLASTGRIAVTTLSGTAVSSTSFAVQAGLDSIAPASVRRGGTVVLTGSGFGAERSTSFVSVGQTKCTRYVAWSKTSIKCRVPAKAALGRLNVRVTTAAGSSDALPLRVKR